MIPDSFKQDLLNRVDLVGLIERYLPLKKSGANFTACCPFHNEKTPSFNVSPAKQFYHCFGCGASGNAISFLMEYQGLGFVEAVRELAQSMGMKLPQVETGAMTPAGPDLHEILDRAAQYYRESLRDSQRAIDYLKGRGLSGKVAARFGLGYAPHAWQNLQTVFADYTGQAVKDAGLVVAGEGGRCYDRFRDRIVFPILNHRGAIIGFGGRVLGAGEPKYLNSPETPLFEKGRELYGLWQARNAIRARGRVIVVEGYMDVIALAQHGVEYAVATLGTATSAVHVQKLFRQTDEIVFCFDGDAAGRRAAWHALEVVLPELTDRRLARFLMLPVEDDPDSYVRARGAAAFEEALDRAPALSEFVFAELRGRTDMKTLEGRSKLLAEAGSLVKKVGAPALRLQLCMRLAQETGMPLAEVARLTDTRSFSAGGRPAPPRGGGRSPARSMEWQILLRLMVNPGFATRVRVEFLDPDSPDTEPLLAFLDFAESLPGPNLEPQLIERFRDTRFEAYFDSLFRQMRVLDLQPEDAEGYLLDALPRIEQGHVRRCIEQLNAKGTAGGLDAEEADQLRHLTARLRDLDRPGAGL
ncbi:MAG: DNA primase [Burkholderiales bacterium]|nr:DNA primase [Burkholderiales bacterium]